MYSERERAEDGTRTRDPNLGKVVLYQLSYFRINAFAFSFAKVPKFMETTKGIPDISVRDALFSIGLWSDQVSEHVLEGFDVEMDGH